MITTTPNYDAAASKLPLLPVFRFEIEQYAKVYVYRQQGRANEYDWITSLGSWGVSVDPTNGSYTMDDLNITVLDLNAAVTHDLSLALLETRRCTLKQGWDGLPLADYVTLFSGIVNDVTSNGDNTYTFTCNDYNRLNQRVVFITGDYGNVVNTTTFFSDNNYYTTTTKTAVLDSVTGGVTTTGTASFSNSGPTGPTGTVTTTSGDVTTTVTTTSRRITTTPGGDYTVYEQNIEAVNINGTIVTTTIAYGGIQLYVNVVQTVTTNAVTKLVTSTVDFTYTTNGVLGTITINDAGLVSSSNPRIVSGHPLDILLGILQQEIGYANSDINLTLIEAYRDTVFTGIEFMFVITNAVDAKDFIENQLLKPLAGYLYPNNLGQLCVAFAQPLPGGLTAVGGITPANITALPDLNSSDLVNVVTMRFDKDDFGSQSSGTGYNSTGYLAESNTFYVPSIADLTDLSGQVAQEAVTGSGAVQGQLILESDGMRSGFQGFLLSKMISNSIFARYGFYNPTFDAELLWVLFRVEMADYVTLTHPLLPNKKTGTIGITNQMFQIIKRTYNFDKMTLSCTLIDASGVQGFGARRIAPTLIAGAAFPDYTVASAPQEQEYLFMSDITGKQSNNDTAGTLG